MTIQTRRWPSLPWKVPFNTHALFIGQNVSLTSKSGTIYRIEVESNDGIAAVINRPNGQEIKLWSYAGQINEFGPENRNWRWIPTKGKER